MDEERWRLFEAKQAPDAAEVTRLKGRRLKPADVPQRVGERVLGAPLARDASAFDLLRRPEVSYDGLIEVAGAPSWSPRTGRSATGAGAHADRSARPVRRLHRAAAG